jgi:glycerol-3-phosphate acyltransferase PlsY
LPAAERYAIPPALPNPAGFAVSEALAIILGYCLGSAPWGYWLPRAFKGVDVRRVGSGNIGAANVWRLFGLRWGIAVAALDVGKGLGAALLGAALAGETGGVLAGIAALAGHWRPLFLRFARGGKIVATTAGVTLALAPFAALAASGVWIVVFVVGRYSSLASLTAAAALPPLAFAFGADWPVLAFTIGATAAIVVLHRTNIRRLFAGTENRFRLSRRPPLTRGARALSSQE